MSAGVLEFDKPLPGHIGICVPLPVLMGNRLVSTVSPA
jgi:hypothetical protein